jgi:hypothetical protein
MPEEMQDIWILMDDDPSGGYYAGQDWQPDLSLERNTIREVRVVSMPKATWNFLLNEGGMPLDQDGSNDSTWLEWWPQGRTVWSR